MQKLDARLVFACPRSRFCFVPIQAISWSPSGAVRIIDQRALPDAEITRDLESAESVAEAIRQLQVRGAPLIGIAAAMGIVTGTREQRTAPRADFLARVKDLTALLGATRPTAVNLRWALDPMVRVAEATTGEGADLWERVAVVATANLEGECSHARQ